VSSVPEMRGRGVQDGRPKRISERNDVARWIVSPQHTRQLRPQTLPSQSRHDRLRWKEREVTGLREV
jgi:hypothetical protein